MRQALLFENIRAHWKKELPFVIYRKPNSKVIDVILQNNSELCYTESFKESGFVFAPFDTSKGAVLLHADQRFTCDQIDVPSTVSGSFENQNDKELIDTVKKYHISLINKSLKLLESEELQKVVLSRKESINITAIDPLEKFASLSVQYPTAMVYCWYHPKIGMWIGATPETLLHISKDSLYTMALAGTQSYMDTVDVVWGEKEIQEQQLVTDAIVDGLTALVKDLVVSEVYSYKAGDLLHLRTDVRARMFEVSLKQLLDVLHPTPAVCGLPKEKAKKFILDNEGYDREFYTGFLGELHLPNNILEKSKETNLFVNLRCMQLTSNELLLYVGGGVTKASVPDKEWEETVKKTNTMKSVI